MKAKTILSWIFRLLAAGIFLQTLYFKFSAAPESIYIFSTLGIEPWGRIGTGIAELVVSLLLIVPRTAWLGAVGGLGVISGAILAHLTKLGIEVQGDGGLVFYLAITVFVSCLIVLYLHREEALAFLKTRKLAA
ncbi:MAG: DoxX family protein [Phaeodactylibacter sp.]|nr:DoxX family protein [Phaeodactylibacter sp.]MCB9274974.1 DoxX family protein [Lewinellaceae bacterium]